MTSILQNYTSSLLNKPVVRKAEELGTSKKAITLLAISGVALIILAALVLAGTAHPGSALGTLGGTLGGNVGGSFLLTVGFLTTCLSVTLGCRHYQRQKARLGGSTPSTRSPTRAERAHLAAAAAEAREAAARRRKSQ